MVSKEHVNISAKPQYKLFITKRFMNNLQKIMAYSLEVWGGEISLEFLYEVSKQIQILPFFPKSNSKNRFLENTETKEYRNIILKKYPYVVTYCIGKNYVRVMNIIHQKRNPIYRAAK